MPTCYEKPDNGNELKCLKSDEIDIQAGRISEIEDRLEGFEEQVGGTFREASAAKEFAAKAYHAAERAANAVNGLTGEIQQERQQRRLECNLRHGVAPRNQLPSVDYFEGEDTKVQSRDEIVKRTKVAEHVAISLEEEVAALKACLAERDRQSERVREKAREEWEMHQSSLVQTVKANEFVLKKWQIVSGIVIAVVAAILALGQALIALASK